MHVIKRTNKGYPQDPTKYFHFARFENQCGNFYLIEAAFEESDGWDQFELPTEVIDNIRENRIVRLEFEEPNKFFLGDKMLYDVEFHKILTLCKYTASWKNKKLGRDISEPIFFPFNMNYLPKITFEKEYDVVYSGHLVSKRLVNDIKLAKQLSGSFRLISNQRHSLVTDKKVSYEKKLEIYTKSRVTLVHNLLYPTKSQMNEVLGYESWRENRAFDKIQEYMNKGRVERLFSDLPTVPQLKSRVFEAAFCKSLIFCRRDDFNVIDDYFEEDIDYISYTDDNFEEKLLAILNNYNDYLPIIESAYQKAISNYTVESFVEKYLKVI